MNKKCVGCGITLQDNNSLIEGYTTNLMNDYCMRCFKLIHYGEYNFITKSNKEYEKLLKEIGIKKSLVLYVVDILSIPKDLSHIRTYLKNNDIILVINKKDVLPYSIKSSKIKDYFLKLHLPVKDTIVISCLNNYHLDLLMSYIDKYKVDSNVYVVGNTNAGKSTLINKIIKNYTIDQKDNITISPLPSTTLDQIKIKVKDYYLIDTPGLVDDGNILNFVNEKMIKTISSSKEIKPITYILKTNSSIIINDLVRIDYLDKDSSSFTFYMSNDLNIKRVHTNKNELLINNFKQEINTKFYQDLVINGLGFIKITNACQFNIYLKDNIDIYLRDSLI